MWVRPVLVVLGAYLLAAIPFGYLIYRARSGRDIRAEGSGNIGATNVMRRAGPAAGIATLLLDAAKGYVAVWLAARLTGGAPWVIAAAAVAALLGHTFPVYLRFRGGKGVATGLGVFAALAPRSVLLAVVVFAITLAAFRYVSLGSIVASAAFPVLALLLDAPQLPVVLGAFACSALIIVKHSSNIRRLLAGTENRLRLRRT
jgi:glycerol-3-phosphate acyltransferase PlsY